MKIVGVIPARYNSSRFPGKALADICGKPMIQHVWEQASKANLDELLIATDDIRIANVISNFGGEWVQTSEDCQNGTERIAEVARIGDYDGKYSSDTTFINIQGDEPLICPMAINMVIAASEEINNCSIDVINAVFNIDNAEDWKDPNLVKVAISKHNMVLYYSRQPIPCDRHDGFVLGHSFGNVGLYAYSFAELINYEVEKQSPLERMEGIEQLRFLEMGSRIRSQVVPYRGIGVDTPQDLARVRSLMEKAMEGE